MPKLLSFAVQELPLRMGRGVAPPLSSHYCKIQNNLGVTNSKGVLPPSGDPHDYLSWAP